MLMNKDVNCSNFIGLMGYLQKHYGDEGVRQVISGLVDNEKYLVADKENPSKLIKIQEHHLKDSAYWVSNEFSIALFANAKKVLGGSNSLIKAGEEAFIAHFSKTAVFVSRIFSLKFICKQAAKINSRFNKTKEVNLLELTDYSATFELRYRPDIQPNKDICNWNLGIYTGIAKMIGVTDVKCREVKCIVDGDEHCVFHMTWRKKPNLYKRFLRWILKIVSKDLVADYEVTVKERDRLIDSLSRSEERYRVLTDKSLTGIFIHSDGKLIYVNDCMAKMLNCLPQEMIGKELWAFVHAEDRSMVRERELARCSEIDVKENYEFRALKKNGESIWLKLLATTINYAGQSACMGNVIDVTSRRQTEGALRESEKRFRELSDSLPQVIFETDEKGNLTFANKNAFDVFGYTRDDFDKGINVLQTIIPAEQKKALENMQGVMSGKILGAVEYTALKKDGSTFPIAIHSNPIIRDNNAVGLRGILIDLTEQKKFESQLRQGQKMEAIGTLAGGIAHDFNNIIGIILGNAELAMDDVPEWNPAKMNLKEIRIASLRAKDVVRQLLSFARKTGLEKKPTNIGFIVDESLKLLRSSIPTSIEIRQNITKNVDTILADPTQINQVLINLCTNANHAMPDGGILEVSLRHATFDDDTSSQYPDLTPGRYVNLTISDTGHGISKEDIDRIFDPYFTTKETGKGTGMGLAVVHGIVKDHKGIITVDSELGKGTTFSIFFPTIEKEAVVETQTDEKLPTGNERILFVDDEELMVKLGRQRLERLGYQVEATTDPNDALELFRSQPNQFDLVITDLTMPKITGDKLVKEILNIRPDIPVILCTGFSEKIDEKKAKAIGAAEYVEKPLNQRDFAVIIRKVLDGN